jgi:hypothetical protein
MMRRRRRTSRRGVGWSPTAAADDEQGFNFGSSGKRKRARDKREEWAPGLLLGGEGAFIAGGRRRRESWRGDDGCIDNDLLPWMEVDDEAIQFGAGPRWLRLERKWARMVEETKGCIFFQKHFSFYFQTLFC